MPSTGRSRFGKAPARRLAVLAVIVLVPELSAAFWKDSAPFPTISATTGALGYDHPVSALVVAGAIVV